MWPPARPRSKKDGSRENLQPSNSCRGHAPRGMKKAGRCSRSRRASRTASSAPSPSRGRAGSHGGFARVFRAARNRARRAPHGIGAGARQPLRPVPAKKADRGAPARERGALSQSHASFVGLFLGDRPAARITSIVHGPSYGTAQLGRGIIGKTPWGALGEAGPGWPARRCSTATCRSATSSSRA